MTKVCSNYGVQVVTLVGVHQKRDISETGRLVKEDFSTCLPFATPLPRNLHSLLPRL